MYNTPHYEDIYLREGSQMGLQQFSFPDHSPLDIGLHFHMMIEMMLFDESEGVISINGEKYVIGPRTLVFIPSIAAHAVTLTAHPKSFYLLQFEPHLLDEQLLPGLNSLNTKSCVLQLNPTDFKRLSTLFNWGSSINEHIHSQELQITLLKLILLFVQSNLGAQSDSQGIKEQDNEHHKAMKRISPLIQHLISNHTLSLSLAKAADLCGLSKYHFSRVFKNTLKINFKDYLFRLRISHAVKLLTTTSLSISEVAYQCDFSDTAYFCRKFKETFTQTPNEFRKHHKKSIY